MSERGGIGIHTGFKLQCRYRIEGSTPSARTKYTPCPRWFEETPDTRSHEVRFFGGVP